MGYWLDGFDWRAQERRLNQLDHFLTEIDGQRIHFVHARSRHPDALPLVLSHGWPGSIVEFLDVFGPLTDPPDPADAFHVVAPSLPGYGFSGPVSEPGWHPRRMAEAFTALMDRLGYPRYGVQGGDWGSLVSQNMADLAPDRVAGLHLNFVTVPRPSGERDQELDPEERASVERLAAFQATGAGYSAIQGTKPQTLGYALDDSPTGLAAWIVEKFRAWSDCGGDVERSFTKDQLLTNVTLYWLTRHGDVVGTPLLRDAKGRPRGPARGTGRRPHRRRQLPRRDHAPASAVGRESLPGHALGRPATGRPLRGDGGPRPVRRRPPRVLPYRPVKTGGCGLPADRVRRMPGMWVPGTTHPGSGCSPPSR